MIISGKNLKRALRIAELTQEQAAIKLGVSRQTIVVWVRSGELSPEIVQKVKSKLGIDLSNNDLSNSNNSATNEPGDQFLYNKQEYQPNILNDVKVEYEKEDKTSITGIPMYNIPASASLVEMYANAGDVKIVGHLAIPGTTKDSFALPVHGHSMYPTLENGSWCILRPLKDPQDIEWGEIYYIEYGDYRMYKRLLKVDEDEDSVTLWSDNQTELILGKPKYAPKKIKKERIRRLCLLTDILKKPNY